MEPDALISNIHHGMRSVAQVVGSLPPNRITVVMTFGLLQPFSFVGLVVYF